MRNAAQRGACGAVGVVAAVALVACSSTSAPGLTSGPECSTTAPTNSSASGTPINLVTPLYRSGAGTIGDALTGAQAAIKYVNSHGGINGRPLVTEPCIDDSNANQAAACANKAVSNPNVVATISQGTFRGAAVDPILENAGMAAVGAIPFTSDDYTSPIVFAPSIGGLDALGEAAAITDHLHGKKVSLVYIQNPAGATVSGLIDQAVLEPRGLKLLNSVGVPTTTADLATHVTKANEGSPDGIIVFLGQAQANSFVKAARQLGITTPLLLNASLETAATVSQQLGENKNVYFFGYYNHAGPYYNDFQCQWAADGQSASAVDDFAISGWLAVTMFANEARKLPTVTRSSVLDAFKNAANLDTGGLTPPLSFNTPSTALGGKAPRLVNPTGTLNQFQNGKFVPYKGGPFINPFIIPKG